MEIEFIKETLNCFDNKVMNQVDHKLSQYLVYKFCIHFEII